MPNILKKKVKNINPLSLRHKPFNTNKPFKNNGHINSENSLPFKLLNELKDRENKNYLDRQKDRKDQKKLERNNANDQLKKIIFYPSASKEWFGNIYSFNTLYLKPLVVYDAVVNKLLKSYCTMLQNKIKRVFKRRRHIKSRYLAEKIYVSRSEVKHTNRKIILILYTFNKQKHSLKQNLRNIIILKKKYFSEKKKNIIPLLKTNLFYLNKWSMNYFTGNGNIFKYFLHLSITEIMKFFNVIKENSEDNKENDKELKKESNKKHNKENNKENKPDKNKSGSVSVSVSVNQEQEEEIFINNLMLLKIKFDLQTLLFYYTKALHFNKSKFNNLVLSLRNNGLIRLIQKIYSKKVEIKFVELKSIHLNSDVFTSAVALKLRNRQNKAVSVLRNAVAQIVKIPDLHTLITFDDRIQNMNKSNVVSTIQQQAVSGVRFEASGRLTKRLTAMRAIFKYRYDGSLKNLRSSLNNKPSTILRGHVKSNGQYTIINSKTRNGAFGLKG